MLQLLCHLIGDYVLQNHAMATLKTSSSTWAAAHAITYTIPFAIVSLLQGWLGGDLFFAASPLALLIICGTHFAIDRWRLAGFWVRFWGVGVVQSSLARALKWDKLPWYYERDPDQTRPILSGECVLYRGTWYQVEDGGFLHHKGLRRFEWNMEEAVRHRPVQTPPWLAVWLLILVDNTLHLLINWISITLVTPLS
jgi:hypothetical protein